MPIQDFVNIVSSQNSINIATDKKIEKEFSFFINQNIDGRVNISVLEELLDQNGFVLDKKNPNYFIIKSKEEILINKMDIFKLEHADTKKIKSQADLILKSYFKNIKKVRTTTKDKQYTPMQEVDADKSNTKIEEIEEKMEYSIQIIDNKSIAVTYKDHFVPQVLKQIIEATDHMPKRIKVQAKIYEVNTNALKEVGTQFNMSAQAGDFNVGANVNPQTGTVSLGVTETNRPLEIGTVIKALEQNGKAKIHSEPSIFLYEGKAAKLTEGKTYPIEQESTTVSNNTTTQTTKYTYQDTGTIMDISFEEFRSDMIYLKMSLSITDVEKFDTEKNQLITLKRELREDLLLNPSKQIFLAGLSKKTEYKVSGGIPVLKEIPYLGALFEFENMKEEKSMIIISIQADLISPLK
jgi:general secretion pathway protein D